MESNNLEPEFYENNTDVVDNFDQLNEKFKNSEWIRESINIENGKESEIEIKNDLNPILAYKKLLIPSGDILNEISTEFQYRERETDPYQRIINLKEELISVKSKIDDHAERFKDNVFVKETENFTKALEELDLYKSKIDAFIDYNAFNKTGQNESDSDNESASNDGRNQSSNRKTEFTSLFEKYNRITENLISQIKITESDIINRNAMDITVKYEIFANPEMQMENLLSRITELEDMLTNLERSIGNWSIYNHNETISLTLTKLLNFTSSKMNEKYDKKYQIFKECGNLISHFLEKKKEKLETGSYFLKIKELYAVLELYEHFDQVFDYIKKRLKAIKEIYDNSDQFNTMLNNLTNVILKNEERFQQLMKQYDQTLKAFDNFDKVLQELAEIDTIIKNKLI